MKKLNLKSLIEISDQLEKNFTMIGIGPMSPLTITASLECAQENDFPLFFIASRNQIESKSMGSGYVMDWDQTDFSNFVHTKAAELNFKGLFYLCRDHGGPWQRDSDYLGKLSYKKSLESALTSYYDDMKNGFELLHIDTSRDPFYDRLLPINIAVERAVELIKILEGERKKRAYAPVVYEVSLEETDGNYSCAEQFMKFIETLCYNLKQNNLPKPSFIVGNTGTLTRMSRNVGNFNPGIVKNLVSISEKFGIAFKEHNTDYLCEESLRLHPVLGISMANVAPEFGKAETEALLEIAICETEVLPGKRYLAHSRFREKLENAVFQSDKWKKWLINKNHNLEDILSDEALKKEIVLVNGHYFYRDPEIQDARKKLFYNLDHSGILKDPERIVIEEVKKTIQKYVAAFNLKNLTTKLLTCYSLLKMKTVDNRDMILSQKN
jgi:D-tagatose-1,6-bisphosphate aldolase subunit GatZ/KbaZ